MVTQILIQYLGYLVANLMNSPLVLVPTEVTQAFLVCCWKVYMYVLALMLTVVSS